MKKFITVLFITAFLFSCKKQMIDNPATDEIPMVSPSATIMCRPVSMGVLYGPPASRTWKTVMQKWFDANGKLIYLKAGLHYDEVAFAPLFLHLEWGEVTYHANQVYVKNVTRNDTIIRVTLDAQQKPIASYYFYHYASTSEDDDRDTSYYYYTGNRLDSIISLNNLTFSPGTREYHKYKFSYDAFGNMVQMQDQRSFNNQEPFTSTTTLTYDYSKPVADMLPLFMVDRQYKLLEYMDLLRFPIHHALINVEGQSFPHFPWNFTKHTTLPNGLVSSYVKVDPSGAESSVYVEWDCDTP